MASTASVISVSNRSLLAIGSQSQIASLTEGSTEANAIAVLFQPCFEQLARTAYWNCLRNQAALSLLAAAAGTPENPDGTTLPIPPVPWLYMYQVPSDCLQSRYLLPTWPINNNSGVNNISPAYMAASSWIPGIGQIPFHVAYSTDSSGNPLQVILTNQTQAQLVYTVNNSDPSIWDSEFQQAMVDSLAAFLVPALALNMTLMQLQIKRAENAIMMARTRDANEGSSQQDSIPDWIRARQFGNGYGAGYGNTSYGGYAGYGNMSWAG